MEVVQTQEKIWIFSCVCVCVWVTSIFTCFFHSCFRICVCAFLSRVNSPLATMTRSSWKAAARFQLPLFPFLFVYNSFVSLYFYEKVGKREKLETINLKWHKDTFSRKLPNWVFTFCFRKKDQYGKMASWVHSQVKLLDSVIRCVVL